MPRQIRVLGHAIACVWAWLVALTMSFRPARRGQEKQQPLPSPKLAEDLLEAAQRTREFLCERAETVPAERGTEAVPPPDSAGPVPSESAATETSSEGELTILRCHQIKDVLSPHPDRRTHFECECGWNCDVSTREIAKREYDEHVKDAIAAFHRFEQLKRMARAHRDTVRTRSELEAALHARNWDIDGPKQTVSGWKATIRRGSASILLTGQTPEQVLEALLQSVEDRERKAQP
jgi:hypothetical protein